MSKETSSGFNPRTESPLTDPGEEDLSASTAVLPGVSPSPTPTRRKGQRRHRSKVSIPGVLVVAGIIGSGVLVTEWSPARWLVYAAWMMPMLELALLGVGQAWFRWRFRVAPEGKVPSPDNPGHHDRQRTRAGERDDRPDPRLPPAHAPPNLGGHRARTPRPSIPRRPGKHRPGDLQCNPRAKARALEYSRLTRPTLGFRPPRREDHLQ